MIVKEVLFFNIIWLCRLFVIQCIFFLFFTYFILSLCSQYSSFCYILCSQTSFKGLWTHGIVSNIKGIPLYGFHFAFWVFGIFFPFFFSFVLCGCSLLQGVAPTTYLFVPYGHLFGYFFFVRSCSHKRFPLLIYYFFYSFYFIPSVDSIKCLFSLYLFFILFLNIFLSFFLLPYPFFSFSFLSCVPTLVCSHTLWFLGYALFLSFFTTFLILQPSLCFLFLWRCTWCIHTVSFFSLSLFSLFMAVQTPLRVCEHMVYAYGIFFFLALCFTLFCSFLNHLSLFIILFYIPHLKVILSCFLHCWTFCHCYRCFCYYIW